MTGVVRNTQLPHALMAEKHVGLVVALAAQVGQGKVGAAAGGHGLAAQIDSILRSGPGSRRLIPVQHGRMRGTACKNMCFKHGGSFR